MSRPVVGRLAPSPSGRMHLGNAFAALLAWLSARSAGGRLLLRLEDIDTERCRPEYARRLMDDLTWLGLDWDGEPMWQTARTAAYDRAFASLERRGLLYPCRCSRADRLAASAPHRGQSDEGHRNACRDGCRSAGAPRPPAWLIRAPAEAGCEDYIVRRADGGYAYQLAVVVDDGESGVTQVVRGADLEDSTPRQIWLHRALGFVPPEYIHVPLLVAEDGRRLAKRDGDLDFAALRARYTPREVVGQLARVAALLPDAGPVSAAELLCSFDWRKVPRRDIPAPRL